LLSVVHFGVSLGMVQLAGPALMRLSAIGGGAQPDQSQVLAIFGQLLPFYFLLLIFSLLFYAVVFAAMNRAVLRPEDDGFGYVRLGADELRQLGLFLQFLGLGILAYIGLIVVMAVIIGSVGVAFSVQRGTGGVTAMSVMITLATMVALLVVWIYFWVRLSLASPMTFATGRISLFRAWGLTRGRFWPMFGAYLVATILAIIVLLLTFVISSAISAIVGGGMGALQGLMQPNLTSVAAYLTPARAATLLINSAAYALVWPVLVTPAAAIYRSLPETMDTGRTASAFD
jgi:hypothetical protein